MAPTPLQQLDEHGQSVWVDYLSRSFIQDGELAGLVDDGVHGVTSNPTIFQGAIAEGDAYDEQLREVLEKESEPKEIFLALAVRDIQAACDVLESVHEGPARDGWVSLEVDPNLAHDTDGTIEEAEAPQGARRPREPVREDPRHRRGAACDRGVDRRRHRRQRDADLLARAPPRGRRGVHPRPAAARRERRRPEQALVGRLVLRLARRHARPTSASTRSAATTSSRASSRSRTPSSPTRPTRRSSRAPTGRRCKPRARARSAACGRRRRPRTPTTGTCFTSRSSSAPTPSTRCRARRSRRSRTTARSAATRSRRTSRAPARCFEDLKAAGIDYDDVVAVLEKEGVEKFAKSFQELFSDVEDKRDRLVAA